MCKDIDRGKRPLNAELQTEMPDAATLKDEIRDEELGAVTAGNMRHEALKAVANNLRG